MSDDTLQAGTDKLTTDELSTYNGTDVSTVTPRIKAPRVKIGVGADGIFSDVSPTAPFPVAAYLNGLISTANSSAATLTSGSVFTGTAELLTEYAGLTVGVFSNVASATDGLSIQQSSDGANWDLIDVYTVPAGVGKTYNVAVTAAYFRIVYTNGGTNQTSFRLQVIFHKAPKRGSSIRPQDARPNDNDMEEVVGYNAIYDPTTNTWDRVRRGSQPTANSMAVALASDQAGIADLSITGAATQKTLNNNMVLVSAGSSGYDALNFRSISLEFVPADAGTVTAGALSFEGSNDNVNWSTTSLYDGSTFTTTTGFLFAASTIRAFVGPLFYRYFRARISTGITGTTTGFQAFTVFRTTTFFGFQGPVDTELPAAAASADALANPTTPQVGADNLLFNGTTWDRQRNNINTTTGDTGAKTTTFNGATQTNYNARGILALLNVGSVTGTGQTMTVKMQESPDGGTNWVDIPGATTAAINATGLYGIKCYPGIPAVAGTTTAGSVASVSYPVPRTWRLVYTIAGATPSFTLTSVLVSSLN